MRAPTSNYFWRNCIWINPKQQGDTIKLNIPFCKVHPKASQLLGLYSPPHRKFSKVADELKDGHDWVLAQFPSLCPRCKRRVGNHRIKDPKSSREQKNSLEMIKSWLHQCWQIPTMKPKSPSHQLSLHNGNKSPHLPIVKSPLDDKQALTRSLQPAM